MYFDLIEDRRDEAYEDFLSDRRDYWEDQSDNAMPGDVLGNPGGLWMWDILTLSQNIPLSFIKDHPDYPWYWELLFQRKDVNWQTVLDNPELPWNYYDLSDRASPAAILLYPTIPWNWRVVSSNPMIDKLFIDNNPQFPWDYEAFEKTHTTEPMEWVLPHRAAYRTSLLKEELIARVYHPDRVDRLGGSDWLDCLD